MIQDMLGNEFYVGVHKDAGGAWTTNKFTDVSHIPFGTLSENTRIWERRLLYCVPIVDAYLESALVYSFGLDDESIDVSHKLKKKLSKLCNQFMYTGKGGVLN
ncbi:hypothetical protein POM88_053702 [Heracleum sosnowskyi]|uniref:Uncharacterized protein n=1 Tax=Heracleum sosnowskyi TaxID=360622 RepID=A0AAD8GPY3_9APIA|nr:hypothetical protein POM88_053702 [Heracleum sosnowskyi]